MDRARSGFKRGTVGYSELWTKVYQCRRVARQLIGDKGLYLPKGQLMF